MTKAIKIEETTFAQLGAERRKEQRRGLVREPARREQAGVAVDRCTACAGVRLDAGEFERMQRAGEPLLHRLTPALTGRSEHA